MTLEDLRPAEGSTHKSKRVGRGRASGHGKTSCRGHNGEGQRSGNSSKRGFEGGQMPSYRQMPKLKGFTNFAALNYAEINVKDIEKLDAKEIDLAYLIENGKAHPSSEALRVLGNGEISKAVTIKARHFTASAKEKIEKAGGKAELV
ncbi:MAG: 50S ribosomal protein L15 [Clostridium sp.]|nr:50S ribosomal protein L15 [Clostridium sp.]